MDVVWSVVCLLMFLMTIGAGLYVAAVAMG
jgi:hypothetical protein